MPGEQLKILSHNTFWFQGAPYPMDEPGEPVMPILSALMGLYKAVGPDVVCLQEVQSERTFRLIADGLGMEGRFCPGSTLTQYGGAVLWKCTGAYVVDSASSKDPPQRMWQIIEVSAGDGATLSLCNIHLPSARQLGRDASAKRRIEELSNVLLGDDPPAIVVGDFNEQPGGPVAKYMSENGYRDAAALAGRAHLPTAPSGVRVDYIWVHSSLGDRVVEYGVMNREMLATDYPGKGYLSDHFPLWVTLEI